MTKAVSWLDRALNAMSEGLYEDHKKVTGEQVRFWLKSKRIKPPETSNMYGALISRAITLGLLKRTEKFATTVTPTSKQSKIRVYSVSKKKLSKAA